MAIRIRSNLDSRSARAKLRRKGDNDAMYVPIERGLQLGWRPSLNSSRAGVWELRQYVGQRRYRREVIGVADDVNDPDGVTVLDYWQAVKAARARLKKNASGASKAPTVKVIMDRYLAFIDHEKKDGLNTRNRIERFVLSTFGDREATSLTKDEIQDWFYGIAAAPARVRTSKKATKLRYRAVLDGTEAEAGRARKATANRILTTFKAAMNRSYDADELECVPVWRKVKPFRGVGKARVRFLNLGECTRLINACSGDFRKLVQAALFTGCRFGELSRLTVTDFTPDGHATISVRQSKSGKSRHIYLNAEAVEFFTVLCTGNRGDEVMLKRGDRAWRSSEQARPIREACDRAKISPSINFHALRHTYASLSLMGGAPIFVVARNLGHTDTRMVELHYGHLSKAYEAEMVRESAPSFGIPLDTNVVTLNG